jgi:diguanylate cyclase (GGDEF)-like protein
MSQPMPTATVLVVDTGAASRRLVIAQLRNHGYRVLDAADSEAGLRLVRSEHPELLMVDIFSPGLDGCELILQVRCEAGLPQPRVMLRAAETLEAETRALAHAFGASFVAKPANTEMLLAVVNSSLSEPAPPGWREAPERESLGMLVQPIIKLVRRVAERNAQLDVARTALDLEIKKRIWAEQELTQANRLLHQQAMRDPVTGLHNRRYLDETLPRELSRAKRRGRPLAVMMIDIDRFKEINDTLGHASGDAVLRAVGQSLVAGARGEDVVARYGGDEFAVVMAQASPQIVWQRAELLRQNMRKLELGGSNGRQLGPVTLSVGIAVFPEHGQDGNVVLQAADAALLRSKQAGRNRVTIGDAVST